jgi:thiamine-phosphate pyrophosphorylase
MPRRQPIPRLWLMTDERQGDALWQALDALPRGAGVVFRHYRLGASERRALFAKVERIARKRRLMLIVARPWRAGLGDGSHAALRVSHNGLRTVPVHSRREAIAAIRVGADALFVSPVFPTRSHPGAGALGRVRFGLLTRGLGVPVIALGGVDARRARSLGALGIHGWAGIDAWTPDQNLKAVPI